MKKSFKVKKVKIGDLICTESPIRKGHYHLALVTDYYNENKNYYKCLIWNHKAMYESPISKQDMYELDLMNKKTYVIDKV